MAQNSSTIVGVFENYSTANSVVQDLVNAGIPRENVEVQSNFRTGAAGRSDSVEEHHEGGISGFFHRLFGGDNEDDVAGHYAEAVRRGHAVVSVTAPQAQLDQAVEIMNQAGAIDVDRRVEDFRRSGYEQYDEKAPAYSHEEAERERGRYANDSKSIPVIEEDVQIGKRAVRRGGVRVYSHIVEQPVDQNVELTEEHVRVERRPVNRTLQPGEADRMREQSIEVTEMAEEAVVQKRARVREEVVVNKDTTKRTEKVRDTVRRTEVEVEQLGDDRQATADYSDDFRRDYETRYGSSGMAYETVQPAYEYGYRSAGDARYSGREWNDVEQDLRTEYTRQFPESAWDRTKDAVRYGWEKVTGRRRS